MDGSTRVAAPAARLDQYLVDLLPTLSRSQVQRLISEGHVRLNGVATRPGARLHPGDELAWHVPPTAPTALTPQPMDLRVLYEDDDLVVIDKPAGLVVHPGPGHAAGTLVHGLLARGAQWSSIGGVERPGIVHRLDKDTSGLLVIARNDAAHRDLAGQLQDRSLRRRYRAIVVGEVADAAARIDAPIGRDPRHRQRMAVVASGREAITDFRRLGLVQGHTLLEVSLLTGRTHQVRVHLAYLHHPVLGDPVYGRPSPLIARPALHAAEIEFRHPRTGQAISLESALPPDFVAAWDALGGTIP
ncbi:MAG TPA: RluA family pseudouridine synthase [Candidatus Eisenbacteria bacterium]|nr:RluA family pseudouridine synthase [Candidatus Eisenbacteria bacterium]